MFSLLLLLAAPLAVAVPLNASQLDRRGETFKGMATFFRKEDSDPNLFCGDFYASNDEPLVALSLSRMQNRDAGLCHKWITVKWGTQTTRAQVKDACATCDSNHIDLSPGAIEQLTPDWFGRGELYDVEWWFDGEEGGGGDDSNTNTNSGYQLNSQPKPAEPSQEPSPSPPPPPPPSSSAEESTSSDAPEPTTSSEEPAPSSTSSTEASAEASTSTDAPSSSVTPSASLSSSVDPSASLSSVSGSASLNASSTIVSSSGAPSASVNASTTPDAALPSVSIADVASPVVTTGSGEPDTGNIASCQRLLTHYGNMLLKAAQH